MTGLSAARVHVCFACRSGPGLLLACVSEARSGQGEGKPVVRRGLILLCRCWLYLASVLTAAPLPPSRVCLFVCVCVCV